MSLTKLIAVFLPVPPHGPKGQNPRDSRKLQSATARQALEESVKRSRIAALEPLRFDALGAPIAQNGFTWSLTHKPAWAGAVVSHSPVGLDVESIIPRQNDRTYDYVGNTEEWAMVGAQNLEGFFRLWTAKEAVLKARGTGLRELKDCRLVQYSPRHGDLSHLTLSCLGQDWRVEQYFFHDHLASITTLGLQVEWVVGKSSSP